MRILVVHNQLWAHYKSKLFEEIYSILAERHPEAVFKVAQIGLYESGRRGMQSDGAALFHYPYDVLFQKSLDEIGFIARTKALFRYYFRYKPTVLNVTGYYDWAQVLLMCYAGMTGVKVVLSSESSADDHRRSRLKELIKRWIVGRADAYFCFGTTSVNYLRHLGVPENKITVRNAAVIDDRKVRSIYEEARRQRAVSAPNFIFVGRLSEEKNLMTLLKSYKAARQQHPDQWGLILVGDGPMKASVEGYIAKENPGEVVLTGGVSWLEVPEWLARADVLVLPSYSEPWGLVVNEALVCGLPVIVSDKCGCAEDLVVPGENGYLFDPENSGALTALLLHFMNTAPSQRRKYAASGQIIVSRFEAKKVAGEMVGTFVSLSHASRK